jgi:hypothetical protein
MSLKDLLKFQDDKTEIGIGFKGSLVLQFSQFFSVDFSHYNQIQSQQNQGTNSDISKIS